MALGKELGKLAATMFLKSISATEGVASSEMVMVFKATHKDVSVSKTGKREVETASPTRCWVTKRNCCFHSCKALVAEEEEEGLGSCPGGISESRLDCEPKNGAKCEFGRFWNCRIG